jgi:hypothetical protein
VTPVPSSDLNIPSSQENAANGATDEVEKGLPSPLTPAEANQDKRKEALPFSSPSRRVRAAVSPIALDSSPLTPLA